MHYVTKPIKYKLKPFKQNKTKKYIIKNILKKYKFLEKSTRPAQMIQLLKLNKFPENILCFDFKRLKPANCKCFYTGEAVLRKNLLEN